MIKFGSAAVTVGVVCCLSGAVRAARAAPDDIVPRGDAAYDMLASLSSAGRIKGATLADFFRGDRLYTRRELAELVADALAVSDLDTLPGSARAQLRALITEFEPELRGRQVTLPPLRAGDAGVSGLFKARGGAKPSSGDLVARASLTAPVGRDGYAAVMLGNYRDEWYNGHPNHGGYSPVETAFVRYNTRALDFTVGRQPLRWGAGYSGALILNDAAPVFDQIRFEKGFALPGGLRRRVGRIYFTQFAGEGYEDATPNVPADATGTRRYVFGRRFETAGDRSPWKLSVSETFKSSRLPGSAWAFVLPFYAYQNAFTKIPGRADHRLLGFIANGHTYPDSLWLKYNGDIQVSYKVIPRRDALVYGDLLIDDIKAPNGISANNNAVPRKLGVQIGGYLPRLDSRGRYGLRLEYTVIDATTYLADTPPKNYTLKGVPLGYPAGANVRQLFGRLDARLSPKLKAAAEAAIASRNNKNNAGFSGDRYSVYGSYALRRDAFVGVRVDHVTGDARLGDVSTARGTRGEVSFGVGF